MFKVDMYIDFLIKYHFKNNIKVSKFHKYDGIIMIANVSTWLIVNQNVAYGFFFFLNLTFFKYNFSSMCWKTLRGFYSVIHEFIHFRWTSRVSVTADGPKSHHILMFVMDYIFLHIRESYSGRNSCRVVFGGLATPQKWHKSLFKTLLEFISHWRGRVRKMAERVICHVIWHISQVPSHLIG